MNTGNVTTEKWKQPEWFSGPGYGLRPGRLGFWFLPKPWWCQK